MHARMLVVWHALTILAALAMVLRVRDVRSVRLDLDAGNADN